MSTDVAVISAWIQGGSMVVASAVAAIAGAMIGRRFSALKETKLDLNTAIDDIAFLLEVEKDHCELHKQNSGESNKNRIRELVAKSSNINWSGKFTPGRARDRK